MTQFLDEVCLPEFFEITRRANTVSRLMGSRGALASGTHHPAAGHPGGA
jgi:hypothetical protein